jgi:predicted RNase H-like nuclease
MDNYIGFDSAWMDNPEAPGAICAVGSQDGRPAQFYAPQLGSFDQALNFIQKIHSEDDNTLVALDQPTIVPNLSGMRPVDRVAASLAGWLGGGVQPANRGRRGIFCNNAPVWRFLTALNAKDDPELARTATKGLFVMEVFPALALASMSPNFFGRLSAPKYNPNRKRTFRLHDWVRATEAAARQANSFGCEDFAEWCRSAGAITRPEKADQDKLDSALCVLIALHWRLRARESSVLIGDLSTGYMILPASQEVRNVLANAAKKQGVSMDGVVPGRLG